MTTHLYFIQGDKVAVEQIYQKNNVALPSFEIPCVHSFDTVTLKSFENELLYFEPFAEHCASSNNGQDLHIERNHKHAVINVNNIKLPSTLTLQPIRLIIGNWHTQKTYNLFKAMQVLRWKQEHSFCSRCGNRTSQHRVDLAMVCNACSYRQYPRLQPCVIVAITRVVEKDGIQKKQILLAKDRRFTRDMQSVIAGFVEVGETLEQAVHREVKEETALTVKNIQYLGSQPWAFPSNLMIAFHAEYAEGELSLDDDELIEADFFDFDNLPIIPPKGSISYEMIMNICTKKPMDI